MLRHVQAGQVEDLMLNTRQRELPEPGLADELTAKCQFNSSLVNRRTHEIILVFHCTEHHVVEQRSVVVHMQRCG